MIRFFVVLVVCVGLALGVSYYKKWLSDKRYIFLTVLVGILAGILVNIFIDYKQKQTE